MKIVVVDALGVHLGFLGCYGCDWVATPTLDRLAAQGVVFDRHYVEVPRTDVQMPPLPWLGRWPSSAPAEPSLGDALTAAGLAWVPLSCDSLQTFQKTFQEGLDQFGDRSGVCWLAGPSLTPPWDLPEDLLEVYWEEDEVPEPIVQPPLGRTPPGFQPFNLQNTYAAVVTFFDAQIGLLVEELEKRGWLEETILIITAGSGFPLGEHGEIGLGLSRLHEELVHVPLVMRLPQGRCAGLRIPGLTQPLDLGPFLAEALGISRFQDQGRNLGPLLRQEVAMVRPYACSRTIAGSWALRTPEESLLLSQGEDRPALYRQPEDRWEVNDVAQQQPELVDHLEKTLKTFAERSESREPLEYPPIPEVPGMAG